ncbi:MAG: DNRLRE domain-containing protein [Limisphaerales bacterium]
MNNAWKVMSPLTPFTLSVVLLTLGAFRVDGATTNTMTLPSVADTSLFENTPDGNLGGLDSIPVGTTKQLKRSRGLFKFNVTGIPSNAVITSVAFTLHVVQDPPTPVNSTFDLHRVSQPWGEGQELSDRRGSPASTGEATWNARLFPAILWSQPGAAAPADFVSSVSAATLIKGAGNYTFASTANLIGDVQFWVNNPTNNFGWILISESEDAAETARRIATREVSTPGSKPALVVQFILPPPLRIYSAAVTNNQFQFAFSAETNQAYLVEFRPTLDPLAATNWATLTNLTATATNIVVTDALAPDTQRFYRVSTP